MIVEVFSKHEDDDARWTYRNARSVVISSEGCVRILIVVSESGDINMFPAEDYSYGVHS